MSKSITFIGCVLLVSGCSISQNVEQADLSQDAEVCIIEDKAVRAGFLQEFERVLHEKGIRYVVTDRSYANANCEWSATYTARWSWDLSLYMSYAEISVFKNGVLDGKAVYDSRKGGANMKKFINAEPKIRELVDELMQRETAIHRTQTTPVEIKQAQSKNVKPGKTSYIDELIALATLRDDGILTEEEFQKQKAEILARE